MKKILVTEMNLSTIENKAENKEKIPGKTIVLWIGQQFSLLGSTLVSFVLLWWVSEITQSEFVLGIATLLNFIPYLIVTPFSGILIDKLNRKLLLFIVDFFQAILTVLLIVIFFINRNTPLINSDFLLISVMIILGLRGLMQVFHEVTVTAIIPFLVSEENISRFNGVTFLGGGIARIVGVLLLNFIDIEYILWIDLGTFILSVIPLFLSKIPTNELTNRNEKSFLKQMKEGFLTIRETKGLFSTILLVPIANFFFSPVMALLPLFVSKIHFGLEEHYAIVTTLWQMGVIVSSTFMCFFKGFKNKIKTGVISISILFVFQSLILLVPTNLAFRFWLIGIILFLMMLFNPIASVSFYAAIQQIIPKEKLGRVISVIFFIANAITPIGIFLSGVIGEYISLGWLFTGSGVLGLLTILSVYFFTGSKELDYLFSKKIDEKIDHSISKNNFKNNITGDELTE